MIGFLQGEIVFSDGQESIVRTTQGIGYQLHCHWILPEGSAAAVFVSHIVREGHEALYAFKSLRDKKFFELLITLPGIGPKAAYSLIGALGAEQIVAAAKTDDKATLRKAPGVGNKSAGQLVLDLPSKAEKVMMYSARTLKPKAVAQLNANDSSFDYDEAVEEVVQNHSNTSPILEETMLACKELGFKEDTIRPIAQNLLLEHSVSRAEQLVHLVLKQL
ncbi:MAG: hypothetical protein CME71_02605 [Halobacteriovorax sp.]|nr:hypothetical protein [Halobacteriovorax sp.]